MPWLYRLRAEQLGRPRSDGDASPSPSDERFIWAINWCVTRKADLAAGYLLWLAEQPGEWRRFVDYCSERGIHPPRLRGSFGSFGNNAKKLGYAAEQPAIAWRQDTGGDQRYSHRVSASQAKVIREVLSPFVQPDA